MVRLVFSIVTILGLLTTASQAQPLGPAIPGPDWTGPYVGVHVGYGFGNSEWCDDAIAPAFPGACDGPGPEVDPKGIVAGAGLGYDHQFGNFVLGAEVDYSYSGMDKSESSTATFICGFVVDACQTEIAHFGTVRGRVGYVYGNALPYITAGFAVAKLKGRIDPANFPSRSSTEMAPVVGAGLEYQTGWQNLSVKLEFLHVMQLTNRLGNFSPECGSPFGCGIHDIKFNVARVGANIRF